MKKNRVCDKSNHVSNSGCTHGAAEDREEWCETCRAEAAEKENTILKGLLAKFAPHCIYCGEKDMSRCKLGFPGCAKMDDILNADNLTTCLKIENPGE